MIRFNSDYTEGAHPRILERLLATNMEQTACYGEDVYSFAAADLIREVCKAPGAAVHFLMGGTQTNLTMIAAALRPYQGVISAETGHINVHETGAIEATGHKILTLPTVNGKLTAQQVAGVIDGHHGDENHEHMVMPKMVYLSQPTELGTLYSLAELTAISTACRERDVFLYIDGARLAYGMGSRENDVDLPDLARLCDAFYIGGTKVGILFGEALVILNPELQKHFRYQIKQRGGMLAKGRILGLQFLTLFEDGLYFRMGEHAARLAEKLKDGFENLGLEFYVGSPTNQQFVILPDAVGEKLKESYSFESITKVDETRSALRFCTSWATVEENVDLFLSDLEKIIKN